VDTFLRLFAAKLELNSNTNAPYWVVILRVVCVL